jgi:hypothetical protein
MRQPCPYIVDLKERLHCEKGYVILPAGGRVRAAALTCPDSTARREEHYRFLFAYEK